MHENKKGYSIQNHTQTKQIVVEYFINFVQVFWNYRNKPLAKFLLLPKPKLRQALTKTYDDYVMTNKT